MASLALILMNLIISMVNLALLECARKTAILIHFLQSRAAAHETTVESQGRTESPTPARRIWRSKRGFARSDPNEPEPHPEPAGERDFQKIFTPGRDASLTLYVSGLPL